MNQVSVGKQFDRSGSWHLRGNAGFGRLVSVTMHPNLVQARIVVLYIRNHFCDNTPSSKGDICSPQRRSSVSSALVCTKACDNTPLCQRDLGTLPLRQCQSSVGTALDLQGIASRLFKVLLTVVS